MGENPVCTTSSDVNVTPHVAQNTSVRCSAVPEAIAATERYSMSQQKPELF